MKNTVQFLNAVKARYDLKSDGQLAKKLDLTRSSISRFMNGRDFLGEETAMKVAALLDLDPGFVFACIASERANKPAVKAAWKHTAQLLGGLAAFVAMLAILPYSLPPDNGLGAFLVGLSTGQGCILCQITAEYWFLTVPLLLLLILAYPRQNRS